MIQDTWVVEDGDLVAHAEAHMGIGWNKACEVIDSLEAMSKLHRDEFAEPRSESNPYGAPKECCDIINHFLDHHDIESFYYVGHV